MLNNNRRNRLDENTQSEISIRLAILEVERLGADERLTSIVTMLAKAKDLLADYIENPKVDEQNKYYKCDECGDFITTNIHSKEWLINQIKIFHLHKVYKVPCRQVYKEITKDEFWELSLNQNKVDTIIDNIK